MALKQLIRALAKSLFEKGYFDDQCEASLRHYRRQREELRCHSLKVPHDEAKKKAKFIRRSTFNSLDTSISSTESSTLNDSEEQFGSSKSSISSKLSGILDSSRDKHVSLTANKQQSKQRGIRNWINQSYHRAMSVRERRMMAKLVDSMFANLGDILNSEFHSTVYSNPDDFDVHERDLKILVWIFSDGIIVSQYSHNL